MVLFSYLQLGAIENQDEAGRCGLTWTHTRQSRISHIESIIEEGSLPPRPCSKGAELPADGNAPLSLDAN
jgi:hypothetical protein